MHWKIYPKVKGQEPVRKATMVLHQHVMSCPNPTRRESYSYTSSCSIPHSRDSEGSNLCLTKTALQDWGKWVWISYLSEGVTSAKTLLALSSKELSHTSHLHAPLSDIFNRQVKLINRLLINCFFFFALGRLQVFSLHLKNEHRNKGGV